MFCQQSFIFFAMLYFIHRKSLTTKISPFVSSYENKTKLLKSLTLTALAWRHSRHVDFFFSMQKDYSQFCASMQFKHRSKIFEEASSLLSGYISTCPSQLLSRHIQVEWIVEAVAALTLALCISTSGSSSLTDKITSTILRSMFLRSLEFSQAILVWVDTFVEIRVEFSSQSISKNYSSVIELKLLLELNKLNQEFQRIHKNYQFESGLGGNNSWYGGQHSEKDAHEFQCKSKLITLISDLLKEIEQKKLSGNNEFFANENGSELFDHDFHVVNSLVTSCGQN